MTAQENPPQSRGSHDTDPDTTGNQHLLDNPQVFGLFLDSVDKRISENIRQRTRDNRNSVLAALAIVATVLMGISGFFFGEIVQIFEERSETAALRVVQEETSRVNQKVEELKFDTQVSALNFEVLSLDLADEFSPSEADSIITRIRSLNGLSPAVQSRKKLAFAVETAVKNFAAANRIDYVEQLEAATPQLLLQSDVALQAMIQVLGHRLISDAGAPRSWLDDDGSMKETYQRYRSYADRATNAGFPELYLVYELLLRYLEKRPEEELENLVVDTDHLNDLDSKAFVRLMSSLATSREDGLPGSERLAARTSKFLCDFRERGELLAAVYRDTEVSCAH